MPQRDLQVWPKLGFARTITDRLHQLLKGRLRGKSYLESWLLTWWRHLRRAKYGWITCMVSGYQRCGWSGRMAHDVKENIAFLIRNTLSCKRWLSDSCFPSLTIVLFRGLPSMMSMKISNFLTPSPPCHIHDHATYQYSCPLFDYPLPPSSADVIDGSPL